MRGNWMHDVNLFAVCAVAVSVTIAFVFLSLSGSLVRQLCAVLDRKPETILRLSYNLIQYLTVFVLLYQIFNYLGFPTSTVLASVGLASLAITLGAQGLVADILSGIFNVFEGGYHVGDYIRAGNFEGTVREIGVRTTMIQSRMQDVKIIENSKIGDVINKTKLNSFVSISLKIPSTESLERIEAILAAELPKIGSGMDKIISGPIYCGGSDVSTSSQPPRESVMTLAISADCLQKDYFEVKATPHNSARANPEKIWVLMKAVFRRNTLCISRKSDKIRAQIFQLNGPDKKPGALFCAPGLLFWIRT